RPPAPGRRSPWRFPTAPCRATPCWRTSPPWRRPATCPSTPISARATPTIPTRGRATCGRASRPASPAPPSRGPPAAAPRRRTPPLYDADLAARRVRAARAAIDASGADVVLTGRAEGMLGHEPALDGTIHRLRAYAEAGADCLFAPGVTTRDQIAAVVAAVAP